MPSVKRGLLSIITPFYNEGESLHHYREQVETLADSLNLDVEFVLVDDHSRDKSPEIARNWALTDPRFQYLRLSRNCGSHTAISEGLHHCKGDCAILLAADLQDPPEIVPQLLERWRMGNDVVWAVRDGREGITWSTKLFSNTYYRMMRWLALPEMSATGADFVLIDRKVIDAFKQVREKNTSVLAMILWLGFNQSYIKYVKRARQAGHSKWTLSKKVKLFVDSIVSFSYAPIRLMSMSGILVGAIGILYACTVIVNYFLGDPIQGWSSLMVIVLVLSGFQLSMLGILGEYLWRAFDQSRGRPAYVLEDQVLNLDSNVKVREKSHEAA